MKYTPINNKLFIDNRKRLTSQLKSGSIAVLNSNDIQPTNGDGTMLFQQNSDIFYLSGIDQEDFIPAQPAVRLRRGVIMRAGGVWPTDHTGCRSASLHGSARPASCDRSGCDGGTSPASRNRRAHPAPTDRRKAVQRDHHHSSGPARL